MMFEDACINWPEFRNAVSSMDMQLDAMSTSDEPLLSDVLYPRQPYKAEAKEHPFSKS